MWQLAFFIFFVSFCIFAGIMLHDSRTLWSGVSFFFMVLCLASFLFFTISHYSEWLAKHDFAIGILLLLFLLAVGCILIFPAILILVFFVEGVRVIRHEGAKPGNLLSMLFSVSLCIYLVVWPMVGNLGKHKWSTMCYTAIGFSAAYGLSLFAMYSLSAVLNLVHWRKKRNADYIVVLGAGILGEKVTPLLAARIEKGIELLRDNPNAVLLMSGGQGPGEDIPESRAMAAYAVGKGVDREKIVMEQKSVSTWENLRFSRELMDKGKPKVIVVTTAYHVFRALILARQQGMRCVGFGAKTKWYFTLNAFIREFVGYLRLTWKRHILVVGAVVVIVVVSWGV